jgi:serine protease inhibitor
LNKTEESLKLAIKAGNIGLYDWNLITNKVYFSPEWKKQKFKQKWNLY